MANLRALQAVLALVLAVSVLILYTSHRAVGRYSSSAYEDVDSNSRGIASVSPKDGPAWGAPYRSRAARTIDSVTPTGASQGVRKKRDKKCSLSFPPKCAGSDSLLKYWREQGVGCYESSLRAINGYSNRNAAERKYVVFQSDLGGWNNIRMALEVVIVFALVTGRILVIPPDAVLYLLHRNQKWKDNFASVDDYVDFSRITAGNGVETMEMSNFLAQVAGKGELLLPLPDNSTQLVKKPLYNYLEAACYCRQWSPGKIFIGFNISTCDSGSEEEDIYADSGNESVDAAYIIGSYEQYDAVRMARHAIGRQVVRYDRDFDSKKAVYFPGHEDNRLLTHYYSMLFFYSRAQEVKVKRFVRDRVRYPDIVYCVAGRIVSALQALALREEAVIRGRSGGERDFHYISFHIRRGDFQHKHTQLPAQQILDLTRHLLPSNNAGANNTIVYISTDEGNRSFFEPFHKTFRRVRFFEDFQAEGAVDMEGLNENYVGMVEQLICANAHTFIGTPLSTFTSYITRMRGHINDTAHLRAPGIYGRSYYFMQKQMYQLRDKPHLRLPFWVREFVEGFELV